MFEMNCGENVDSYKNYLFFITYNGRNYLVGWEDPANFPSFIKGHWSHQ